MVDGDNATADIDNDDNASDDFDYHHHHQTSHDIVGGGGIDSFQTGSGQTGSSRKCHNSPDELSWGHVVKMWQHVTCGKIRQLAHGEIYRGFVALL